MTLKISVKSDARKLSKLLTKRQRKDIPRILTQALNRTATQVQSGAVKSVAKETGLKQKDVKAAFKRTKANFRRLTATVAASGRHLNLARFAARQTRRGVTAKAWGKRKLYRGTFIGNTGRTVFVRSKRKGGIRGVWGPSIPRTMLQRATRDAINDVVKKRWRINVNQALNRRWGKTVRL